MATDMFEVGEKVVVIGGGLVGCETALHMGMTGHDVTVIEMRDDVAIDATADHRRYLMPRLKEHVKIACSLRVTKITADAVEAVDGEGKVHSFPADSVLIAAGLKARTAEVEALRSSDYDFVVIGDAKRARNVYAAVREGFDAATFVR